MCINIDDWYVQVREKATVEYIKQWLFPRNILKAIDGVGHARLD